LEILFEQNDSGRGGDISKSSAEPEESKHASHMDLRVVLTLIGAVAALVFDALTPVGLAAWLFQVILVWIASLWANRGQLIAIAAACATFTVLAFWFSPGIGPARWVDLSNLLLSLGAMGVITHTCLRQRATEDARRKAAEELKQSQATVGILSGLLPICAWCKRIRNEAGAWEELETYIHNHSHAEITHGLCQECSTRLHRGEDA
jgi:hypothetical protein